MICGRLCHASGLPVVGVAFGLIFYMKNKRLQKNVKGSGYFCFSSSSLWNTIPASVIKNYWCLLTLKIWKWVRGEYLWINHGINVKLRVISPRAHFISLNFRAPILVLAIFAISKTMYCPSSPQPWEQMKFLFWSLQFMLLLSTLEILLPLVPQYFFIFLLSSFSSHQCLPIAIYRYCYLSCDHPLDFSTAADKFSEFVDQFVLAFGLKLIHVASLA